MEKTRQLDGHYETKDIVSVWIGTFPSEGAFVDYLAEVDSDGDKDAFPLCRFWEDLGIQWHDHDFQEAIFRSDPLAIEELVANISWVGSYLTCLLSRCKELGICKANAVIVICEYDYPTTSGFNSPYLTFVGSFQYSTGGYPFRRDRSL